MGIPQIIMIVLISIRIFYYILKAAGEVNEIEFSPTAELIFAVIGSMILIFILLSGGFWG